MRLPIGGSFAGRYRLEGVLGEGVYSVVYAATDERGAPVALKVIHRHLTGDQEARLRFEREARALARLEGEHVVRMIDFAEDDGLVAIVLERSFGQTLEALLAERSPLAVGVAIEVTLQVCAALGAAHASGIVHRDLNPSNVLVEHGGFDGEPKRGLLRVKVVDFGLCKVLRSDAPANLTSDGAILGTAAYMAPEQARGDEVDARADLYAVGVMLYEMTVGATPFAGRTPAQTLTAHLDEAPRPPREVTPVGRVSAVLDAVILRALAKQPADRFSSARELAEAIVAARDEAKPPSGLPRIAPDDDLETGDTELHLVPVISEGASTIRANEVDLARASTESARPVRVVVSAEPLPIARPPARVVVRPVAPPSSPIQDEPTAVSGEPKGRHGVPIPWVIVTIVAALAAIIVGAVFGAR